MKIIFATHNKGKLAEMKKILEDFDVLGAEEVGVFEDVIEDGKTFEENSLKKARFVNEKTGLWSVADDTGLCVNALDGMPGLMSARWAGENTSDKEKVDFLLDKMKKVPLLQREAYFETAVALISPKGKEYVFKGKISGVITDKAIGKLREKLPYDLIFIPNGHDKTFAEMTNNEKNSISHRGLAFEKLKAFLEKLK